MFNLNVRPPVYDPVAVQPMRDELLFTGFIEMRTSEVVDNYLLNPNLGTVLVFINSVCGCAAGSARPGVNLALQHSVIPDVLTTSFAGQDRDAVDRIRAIIRDYPPSSPSIALFKNGKLTHMVQRLDIEGRDPYEVASVLINLFDKYCTRQGPSISPEEFAKLEHERFCGSKIPRMANKYNG